MSMMGPKILQAIREAIAELRAMDRNELRLEIQNREIGEFGAMLLETGTLETGPLHVGVEIESWDESFRSDISTNSWVRVQVGESDGHASLATSGFDFSASYDLGLPAHVEDCEISQSYSSGADDYPYSVAA
jgi:hypothetical protein